MASQRDVTMGEEDGKVLGGHSRSNVLPVVRSIVIPTAMGSGLNDGACDTTRLLVSEVLAHAIKANVCGYVISTDAAFASLHRNLAMMDEDDGNEAWLKHLVKYGFTQEQAESILAVACSLITWTEHVGTEHSFAIFCEAH